ncbi:hypothetical protein [Nocardioides houyundeii]|uniref:hypothetical protein n=1 Tax=Nocardioides houyundeii TaxID=2045452 RepID=UPI0013B4006D|nr:hypothetical protein [Nocardioides houyundeii]
MVPQRRVSDAVRLAQEVVGLYGDPDAMWGIGVELRFDHPLPLEGVTARLEALVEENPHLGAVPVLERVGTDAWGTRTERSLNARFGDDGRLVRVLVGDGDRTLFVSAHHGVCDGLGLLAIADAVAQAELRPGARGIGRGTRHRSFLLAGVVRVLEALTRPPVRFLGAPRGGDLGERLQQVSMPALRVSSGRICLAVAQVYDAWPGRVRPGRRPLLVLLGASRREPGTLVPDRRTAYFRLSVDPAWSPEQTSARIAGATPEPDFPETSAGGIGPRVTRLLRNRLGGTAMVSNLGTVGGKGLVGLAMFPALSGPQAVGVGVATTATTTTVSLRTRQGDFSTEDARRLLDALVSRLLEPAPR